MNVMHYIVLLLASLACVITGCNLINSGDENLMVIQTDKEMYDLNEHEFFEVAIKNISAPEIYYSGCSLKQLEILNGKEIVDTFILSGFPSCACLCPVKISPGIKASIETIKVPSFRIKSNYSVYPELFNESYIYRIRLTFYFVEDLTEKAPPEWSYSNAFKLTGFE